MITDHIVEEVRKIREAQAAQMNFDIKKLLLKLKRSKNNQFIRLFLLPKKKKQYHSIVAEKLPHSLQSLTHWQRMKRERQ